MFFSALLLSYTLLASTYSLFRPRVRMAASRVALVVVLALSAPPTHSCSALAKTGAAAGTAARPARLPPLRRLPPRPPAVSRTLVVPHLLPAAGGASTGFYGVSAWVGLDSMTCKTSLMATGINILYLNGTTFVTAWTEVFPSPTVDLSMIVNAGDTITLTVAATSPTTGTAVVENLSNGQNSTDVQDGGFLLPFANFGNLTFTDTSATTQAGSTVGPSGSASHLINMVQSSRQFTSASTAASSVTIDYLTSIPF
ncbi:concanavalin A-like lectin/glucanase domain-containing protein [Mycena epipterygia]|nr:concanavalin A-like lectin/glucanase domain-containing protein [Mycena epipterygia]